MRCKDNDKVIITEFWKVRVLSFPWSTNIVKKESPFMSFLGVSSFFLVDQDLVIQEKKDFDIIKSIYRVNCSEL